MTRYVVSRDVYSMFIRWERQSGELCARLRCRVSVLDTMFRGFECTDADTVRWSAAPGLKLVSSPRPTILYCSRVDSLQWPLV